MLQRRFAFHLLVKGSLHLEQMYRGVFISVYLYINYNKISNNFVKRVTRSHSELLIYKNIMRKYFKFYKNGINFVYIRYLRKMVKLLNLFEYCLLLKWSYRLCFSFNKYSYSFVVFWASFSAKNVTTISDSKGVFKCLQYKNWPIFFCLNILIRTSIISLSVTLLL